MTDQIMRTTEGQLIIRDERIAIIAARFNESIVDSLVSGAVDALKRHGAGDTQLQLIRVPGALELPLAAQRLAKARQVDGIVALGVVIRGATPHFDYVCSECASGLQRVSLEYDMPIGFGVLTCDTIEQAVERAGTKAGNKGADAAMATIEMINVLQQLGD
ncbi:MAG: 6,7-dimethyl-8-ribityllumazine synthase [Gammaproteobacteria bacterium]|jgi:6,7-dimethyl-8-ribityllumazine synthase|nr:6,7-dimethyl-8-ribityllumazine synthase [Chromatiales bacterium]MCP4927046.1 6,7-dimethyl-8-ribityllumazine synthase [Gammaproteobacteria bacterium]MDP7153591.1 6,7-dimethyl-8-ribityllumazine synthase [Gammaproteobacteria bacterium]MDP7297396.1 6,7-dimethyl-8-ribityllumazine synthase [Gammaproteobacteria bacterium]MDP7660293.1 6,7-dimethyl-8-ribityllumazine synthase [Gammaproteobacteria bacterium]